jgi:hypothetical protein
MMKKIFGKSLLTLLVLAITIGACRKKDAPLPDNLAQFESNEQGLAENSQSLTVKIRLSRATDRDIPLTVSVTPSGVNYTTDFTTTPAANAGNISLTVPSGNIETSFTITKANGALFDGDETVVFKIESTGAPVIIGTGKQFTLKFAELVAASSSMVVNGGGASFGNKVFIDLSANKQTAVLRTNWDLGFYTHADSFRVILNSSSAMMAKQINKNDLNAVTAADTVGFSSEVAFSQLAPSPTALPYIDYPNGDLSRTAIASIAANAADNKVYIVNRGLGVGSPAPARGWKKIRIIRNANGGYTLQHADINATSFQEIQVSKDNAYFFKYISFENGTVNVEPAKDKWDIAWTYFSNVANFGAGEVPYLFQDIVLQNRNVQVAKVLTSAKAYADFSEADIAAQTFVSSQTGIGSDWRSGGGPSSAPAVRTDRYYIIKDGNNNYYKLRFTALTQNGERGYPAFEYALVKRGS